MTLARVADRAAPYLFTMFLLTLTVSISAAQITLALLAIAELCRLTQPDRRATYRFPLLAPLLTFAAVTLLSAALSSLPRRGFFEAKDLLLIGSFYLAVNSFDNEARSLKLLRWFFGAVAIVSFYGLLQIVVCRSEISIPPWTVSLLRVKLDACRAMPFFRAKGFYSIYMTYAGVLLLAVTVMLAFIALLPWRKVLSIAGPALITTLALGGTFVRGAWVGLVISFSMLFILTRRLRLIGLVAIPIALALFASPSVRERMQTAIDPRDTTAEERLHFWRAGVRMVRDHPWFGVGPGHVRLLYSQYRDAGATRPSIGHLHNNVVQIAAERGLLGLGAWLWLWVAFVARASRIYLRLPSTALERRAAVAGSLAAAVALFGAGLFEYNFGDSEVQMLLWVVMALPFAVEQWPRASVIEPNQ